MQEINTSILPPTIRELLTFATSASKIDDEYKLYQLLENRKLYGYMRNGLFVGCIGIQIIDANSCEIKQIAVSPLERRHGIGKRMIDFIYMEHSLELIFAETDQEAVDFYKNCGFTITSLGEKYPGVERFYCKLNRK